MNIESLNFYSYKLKFCQPLRTSKETFIFREGFIIRLTDGQNTQYFGEVAPLPSFGTETAGEASDKLNQLKNIIKNTDLPEIFNILNSIKLYNFPAVKSGMEQAIINFSFLNGFEPVTGQFQTSSKEFKVAGITGASQKQNCKPVMSELIEAGIKTFKIKTGKENFENDLACIKTLRDLDETVAIRLDVNGAWSFREAKKKIEKLTGYGIEFIEQPVKSLNDLYKLSKILPIPIAVDESIKNYKTAKEIIESGIFKFVILKPAVLGSILDSLKLIDLGNTHKVNIIISSSFESVLGKSILYLLAAQTNHNFAHGLVANKIFDDDLFRDPFCIKDGKVKFELARYIDFIKQLTELEYDEHR